MVTIFQIFLVPQLSVSNYLDPGSGSLIIQLLLGALLAIGLGVRIFWSRIKRLFSRNPPSTDDPSHDESDGTK